MLVMVLVRVRGGMCFKKLLWSQMCQCCLSYVTQLFSISTLDEINAEQGLVTKNGLEILPAGV